TALGRRQIGRRQVAIGSNIKLSDNRASVGASGRYTAFALQGADDDVVEHRKAGEGLHDLEGAADAGGAHLVRTKPLDLFLVEDDLAGIGRVDAGDHVEDGGLDGAVRADEE